MVRKYILQITQYSQYRYAKLQYRFAVISGSPSICTFHEYRRSRAQYTNIAFHLSCPSCCLLHIISLSFSLTLPISFPCSSLSVFLPLSLSDCQPGSLSACPLPFCLFLSFFFLFLSFLSFSLFSLFPSSLFVFLSFPLFFICLSLLIYFCLSLFFFFSFF